MLFEIVLEDHFLNVTLGLKLGKLFQFIRIIFCILCFFITSFASHAYSSVVFLLMICLLHIDRYGL